MREALEDEPSDIEAMTDRWISRRGRTLHLWEDGEVVSLAGVGSRTPNGVRIGPVYTPPEARNRGYASALVAAISQAELDAGRRFCFLFTDLANPTANHIYQAIGYEPVRDVDMWRHDRPVDRSARPERGRTPSRNLTRPTTPPRHRTDTLSALRRGRRNLRPSLAFDTGPDVPPARTLPRRILTDG